MQVGKNFSRYLNPMNPGGLLPTPGDLLHPSHYVNRLKHEPSFLYHFGKGAVKNVVGTAKFVNGLVPKVPFVTTWNPRTIVDDFRHPSHYLHSLGNTGKNWVKLGRGVNYSLHHPVAFGKALVGWNKLSSRNPNKFAEGAGALAPGAALALLTGGGSAAAKGAEAGNALSTASTVYGAIGKAQAAENAKKQGSWGFGNPFPWLP
jgi:hypothetical protein